jgi:hypothetical protein
MKTLSSRPVINEDPLVLEDLVPAEVELISALLCTVRLGRGNPYREAAFSLMQKITKYVGDDDYITDCYAYVAPHVDIMDANSNVVASFTDYEIVV